MNARERFLATMQYEPRDRPVLAELSFWPETLDNWKQQGLPEDIFWINYDDNTTDAYFGLHPYRTYLPIELGLCPPFDVLVIEDRGETELIQQNDGVWVVRSKRMSSIPHPERYLLTGRAGWEQHYRPRLNPDHPARYSLKTIRRMYRQWERDRRPAPLVVGPASLFGWIRNWMGLEHVCLLIYDDPVLFEEIVTAVADCVYGTLRRLFASGVQFDALYYWEDMCYNSGPMIGPEHAKKFLLPHYRRINDLCLGNGVRFIALDSDGRLEDLVPVWLEAGVQCLYPVEIGTTGNDPVALKRRFGKDLRLMGGFDKRILAGTKRGIEDEVRRLAPLVEEGGYVPLCDHYVPPDVPFDNYLHYRDMARRVWAGDHSVVLSNR